jgi:hypothetical protein
MKIHTRVKTVNKGSLIRPCASGISSKHEDTCPVRSHGMTRPSKWTCPLVVEFEPSLCCILHVNKAAVQHAKSLTRQLKGIQVIEINCVRVPAIDIHKIIDKDSSVTATGRRNGPSAL